MAKKKDEIQIPKWVWLFFSVILGIVGGVIGAYFNWKENRAFAMTLLIIGFVVTLIITAIKVLI